MKSKKVANWSNYLGANGAFCFTKFSLIELLDSDKKYFLRPSFLGKLIVAE